ncbi:hypothetical protein BOX37_13075 [Nocardia mangyaensis]|uniref:DUF8020 domain-containing protein n=1 Tax=Nocardia mangyaensis TaxID=2213200 RepID=A0A1J0VRQ2_9NOCA|nr:hypothetical protein [Nocardia mangyaensis]APE34728.1 hypothetical protein BOX37_13075 [Nocardia mangyaensis]
MRMITAGCTLLATVVVTTAQAGLATPQPADQGVNYTASVTEKSTIIATDAGDLAVEDGVFKIMAADGTVLAGTELRFRVDDFEFPIAAEIKDRTATLTPQFDMARAIYRPVALPFEDQAPWTTQYDREQAAFARMLGTINIGATIGGIVGGIGGGAVGCVLGGIAGATVASATIIGLFGPFIPAAAIGCIGGIMAIGALGALAGQLLIAAPIAIMAVAQYFTTINQPMPTPATTQ